MAQFDLYRLRSGQLVVDLQTDLIGLDASRIVAPLRPAGQHASFPGLTPEVRVGGALLHKSSEGIHHVNPAW